MKYLKKFNTHTDYESFIREETYEEHTVSVCTKEEHSHFDDIDYSQRYLTLIALEDGTFKLKNNSANYSLDNGKTWVSLASDTDTPTISAGSRIMWKATLTPRTSSPSGIGTFASSGTFDAEGNPMSLLYGDDFKNKTDFDGNDCAFSGLFMQSNIVNANNIKLVAKTLTKRCYDCMFYKCYKLLTAPELPATTLADWCYDAMFHTCSGLTEAPALHGAKMEYGSCALMFYSCSALATVPSNMLPATTLAEKCYDSMFFACTSLTKAPDLPATTLATECYDEMFQGCTSLNYVKAMFTTTPSNSYTHVWLDYVGSNGTFVKNSAATWTNRGVSAVPTNWTIETASS